MYYSLRGTLTASDGRMAVVECGGVGYLCTISLQTHGSLPSLGEQVSDKILYNAGVFITPGFIFGKNGRDYIRLSLCAKPEILERSAEKILGI